MLEHEFPFDGEAGLSRREFVQLLGASMALAGLGACMERPKEKILPYVRQPAEPAPELPRYYATAMVLDGYATGLLVKSNAGRPTKIEGNPDHPASFGAAGVYEQASVLQLYDPNRARAPTKKRRQVSWSALRQAVAPSELSRLVGRRGAGLRILLQPTASPLVAELLERVQELYPEARAHFYAPLRGDELFAGARATFGRVLQPQYDFRQAEVVLSLDADFLAGMPFHLRYARDFAARRRVVQASDPMNRLYVAEGVLSSTGVVADHRLRVPPSRVSDVAIAILRELIQLGLRPAGMAPGLQLPPGRPEAPADREWARTAARDLARSRGRSVVIVGEHQPAAVHVAGHLLNSALGNVGRTIRYIEPPLLGAGEAARGLAPLIEEMRTGQVEVLLILEGNPSYTAPADAEFSLRLRTVPHTLYLGLYHNETARDCTWFAPALHYLESWGDARAYDGTASIVQPLIAPLYGGMTPHEVLALLVGERRSAHEMVRESWRRRSGRRWSEGFWEEVLQRGLIGGTAAAPIVPGIRWPRVQATLESMPARPPAAGGDFEVAFFADPRVYDGSFGNNAWLQELPDPVTKLTWDNAALLSPAEARRLAVETGDLLDLFLRDRRLRIPALVAPGCADGLVGLRLGYGRTEGDELVAARVGFDSYRLRTWDAPYFSRGLRLQRVRDAGGRAVRHPLAVTQSHWSIDGRPLVLQATLDEFRENPNFTRSQQGKTLSLYQPHEYTGDQWAMVIDLSACTGCSACVVACQAENNTPVVGKEGVLDSREMHWLRIDRYFSAGDEPAVVVQPMLCQHCEKAPCEYVCPVSATVHSPDGLNEMVYNRCVGTRFCSNNCPYKVRRFNWFDYNKELAETEQMVKNPEVTVRARGVMEKCTFCVQRIREGQIAARLENRQLGPEEVRTACQQACPTEAIVFGSYSNPESEVARRRGEPRVYSVLHHLGTEPRVQYLARLTNPNPALGAASDGL